VTTSDPRSAPRPPPTTVWAPLVLVLVNTVPLFGVLLFEWRLFDLMLLYWLENGVIGIFTLLKILTSRAEGGGPVGAAGATSKVFVALFFSVHYGVFWAVHGVFVFALFGGTFLGMPHAFGIAPPIPWEGGGGPSSPVGTLALAFASLVISHGVSYVTNFLERGEDRTLAPNELMTQPYGRVLVLHAAILGGGLVVMMLGTPLAALLLLVALKTGVDLSAHLREHRSATS
jgi:hypothetical protein